MNATAINFHRVCVDSNTFELHAALSGNDPQRFCTLRLHLTCLEFDSASYLRKARAAAATTVAAPDAPDSPEPE
ncbi:hypothetical protein RR46_05926 [Papilio xuthus]|uniref:Uncharacterized protein n=1 Tax=Papilio xuthus TaxID=66420 RepID=A0A194PPL4_PAPXU|nr:hypothetical protein RR46_05926 [Papilio xuthus]